MGNLNCEPDEGPYRIDVAQLRRISQATIAHYDRSAAAFWNGTRDHNVSQNYRALLDAIDGYSPYSILDLGCGPGRDLHHFSSLGHNAVGLTGQKNYCYGTLLFRARFCTGIFSRWHCPSAALTACLQMRHYFTCRPGIARILLESPSVESRASCSAQTREETMGKA
jgi:hypothetical protein